MSAKDYKVTYPYGATSPPYSVAHPHRGNDRACPTGTPVEVNGTVIGLTGNTGRSTGSHLHIQEWKGDYATTRKPINEFEAGTVSEVGVSTDFGNYINIVNADGWTDTYAHLSKINVKKGQKVGVYMLEKQPPVFNARYYLNMNPDVNKKYNVLNAVDHWLSNGIKEGRKSAPNFHVKEYLANYGDLQRAYGKTGYAKAVKHYFNNGINEGRSGRTLVPDTKLQALKDKIINFVRGA